MEIGHFYFLKNKYYEDFPDNYLMKNHEVIGGIIHNRPCLYVFQDTDTGIYWTVPISSKTEKFRNLYDDKISRYGKCDTIDFAYMLGHEKAFLIQNMCPITCNYVENEYISNGVPVQLDNTSQQRIISKAKKVLQLQRQGTSLVFPDILYIESELKKQENSSEQTDDPHCIV